MARQPRVTDMVNPITPKPPRGPRLVNRITILLDESGSMGHLKAATIKYANEQIANIKKAAAESDQTTYITVLAFSYRTRVVFADQYFQSCPMLTSADYNPNGGTALSDAVRFAIDNMPLEREGKDDTSHLVITLTDGEENASQGSANMSGDLRRAQSLGNWTFAFLGPRGSSRNLINLGVPAGNVTEWEQTENGMRQASVMTSHATSSYYEGRARGVRASSTLFTDLSGVKQGDLKKLEPLTGDYNVWQVSREIDIKSFVEGHGVPYCVGHGYYELTKPERIQAHKGLIIRDKKTGYEK